VSSRVLYEKRNTNDTNTGRSTQRFNGCETQSHHGSVLSVISLCVLCFAFGTACGKKGPPLAPLQIAPKPPTEMKAHRIGDRVAVSFKLPTENTVPSTGVDVGRVDVYALSVDTPTDAPTAVPDIIRHAELVAKVDARLPPSEEEETGMKKEAPERAKRKHAKAPASVRRSRTREEDEKLPAPGDTATVVEELGPSAEKLYVPPRPKRMRTIAVPELPSPEPIAGWGVPAFADSPAFETAPPPPPTPVRMYFAVPVTWKGRPGAAAGASVPLTAPPPTPVSPQITFSEKQITVAWTEADGTKSYNVYEVKPDAKAPDAGAAPLNAAPVSTTKYDDSRMEFGKPRCYAVTSVRTVQPYSIESAPSAPACVTPADTFPPAAPKGLAAVAGPGSISLIWDANTEPDLSGYLVLRGDAAGGTLQALTPEPIHETTFKDATARPGVTYVYAVVAVDNAKNLSAQSAGVQETAR
jgi:hypothetical protein